MKYFIECIYNHALIQIIINLFLLSIKFVYSYTIVEYFANDYSHYYPRVEKSVLHKITKLY